MTKLKKCAICNSRKEIGKYIEVYNPKTDERNILIKCSCCGLIYAQDVIAEDKKFTAKNIDDIKQEYEELFLEDLDVYSKNSWGDKNQDVAKVTKEQFDKTERILGKTLVGKKTIIEIGSARGYLLNAIKKQYPNISLIGVEPSPVMAGYAKDNGLSIVNGVFQDGEFKEDSVDAVISYGAFICVRDPNDLLLHIIQCLKNNGRVVFDSPNGESLTRKILHFLYPKLVFLKLNKPFDFHVWQAFNPRRFYFYSPKTFEKLLSKYNLEIDLVEMYQPRSLLHNLAKKPLPIRIFVNIVNWLEIKFNLQNWVLISAFLKK